ncbi:MAG: hypothetical protein O7A06_17480 [Acidobacteria bacterium]|nr:hypothetical protein [Acidobacteriota bacterium]MCZ6750743.1 hypothetical protein [Acidobacteriota bacterium]
MFKICFHTMIVLAVLAITALPIAASDAAEAEVLQLLREDRPFHSIPPDLFEQLGWDLPDDGAQVKSLADNAAGSAFDPRRLEALPADSLGYRAKWHEVKYEVYGLEWDIPGLLLTPNDPVPGLPTVAIINGGSANWYEFFLDPLNGPGLGQYLAQKVPVLLITIPGNYRHGGWQGQEELQDRVPGYVLDRNISAEEARLRNAVFTFRVITEGVRRLIETTTSGPVLVVGHSTGGEIRFLLEESSLKTRMGGLSLGWGTGGPASLDKVVQDAQEARAENLERFASYPPLWELRARSPEGYVRSKYIGPLNPSGGNTDLAVARRWHELVGHRRPQFKQVLQDLEHQGAEALRERAVKEIRQALEGNKLGVNPDEVIPDLFSTLRAPVTGYRKMIWAVAQKDNGHWNADPEKALEFRIAKAFRQQNPDIPIRVMVFDVPMTHYGHIEKARQVAGGLLAAMRWLMEP